MTPILHIPHSSKHIPERFIETYIGGEDIIESENNKLCDLHTDTLFQPREIKVKSIIFPYSRIFVDVERFRDSSQEVMAERGMGVLYTNGHKLNQIRNAIDTVDAEKILTEYYDTHHDSFKEAVEHELLKTNKAVIIDCHSFPKEKLPYEGKSDQHRPEICIGTDNFHTPKILSENFKTSFENLGYEVKFNTPFYGSIVPLKYYKKNKDVISIMIEVRRDLFIDETSNAPNGNFDKVRGDIERVLAECLSNNNAVFEL